MYKRKTKLSPIHISLIALAILVVIAVIVTFAVKKGRAEGACRAERHCL